MKTVKRYVISDKKYFVFLQDTVRGYVVDGLPDIGTMFVPK